MSIDNCNGFVYVVQENDSLYGISRRFNISLSWLINANIDNDIYNLFLGKRICIPNRDPYIDIIPIIPIRPWPGNVNGPGPVESDKDVNPYTSGPRFDPRDPRYGTENPFGRIGDADEDDEYTSVVYDEDDEEEDFTSTDLEKVEDVSETESSENGGQMVESTEREDDMWNSGEYDTDYDSDDRANYNQDSSSGVGNFDNVIGPDPRNPRYRQRTGDGTGRINDNDVNIGTRRTNGDMMNDGTGRTNGGMMNGGTGRTNGGMMNGGTRRTNGDMMNDGTGRTNGGMMNGGTRRMNDGMMDDGTGRTNGGMMNGGTGRTNGGMMDDGTGRMNDSMMNDGTGRTNGGMMNGGTGRTNGGMMNGGTGRTNGNRMNGTVDGVTDQNDNSTPYVLISYVVKNDDNLSAILERFNITPADVLRYNDTLRIYLKPGTVIRVPNTNAMDEQKHEPN